MSWKLKHPNWYLSEINELSSSNIYNEKYQTFNKILVSSGELVIRRKIFTKYPILIIYPKATPFKPPKIYILNELLSSKEVELISNEDQQKFYEIIGNKKKLIYRRHQMSDGEICFIESDNLYNNSPHIFNISDILKRIIKWIIGIESDDIPNDNNEVEFFAHFPEKTYELNILLPKIFYNSLIDNGEFYLFKFPRSYDEGKNTFVGVVIRGTKLGVAMLPQKDSIFGILADSKFENLLDLITKNEKLKKEKEQKIIIEGSWWNINFEPTPFSDIRELFKLLSNNEDESLRLIYQSQFYNDIFYQSDLAYFGLRFKNRKGLFEWIIFQLRRNGTNPQSVVKKLDKEDILNNLTNYSVKVIKTNEFTDDSYHLRNKNRANREILRNKGISLIGCGALGSEIADCLGKAGIGELNFIDNQFMEPNNPIRHLCGLETIGQPKVDAVAMNVFEHNPFIFLAINKSQIDVYNFNINQYVKEKEIGISSIADDNTESFLNEQAVINRKTIFYSRVLRGGKVGRIFRVVPGIDACFRCLLQYKLEGSEIFFDVPEDEDYPTILNECNNPIRPASAADIKLIASISSRILVDYLQSGNKDFNHWIYYSESFGKITIREDELMSIRKTFIPPHPNCPLCSIAEKIKVRILKDVFEFMRKQVIDSRNIETGGILIGFKGKNNYVYVCKATGPGPNAKRTENWFERDIEYCQKILNKEYEKYGKRGIYIGEWHCHPSKSNIPSNRDLLSLTEIAESENYLIDEPIMLIFSNEPDLSCTTHPMGKIYYKTEYEIITGDRNEV